MKEVADKLTPSAYYITEKQPLVHARSNFIILANIQLRQINRFDVF